MKLSNLFKLQNNYCNRYSRQIFLGNILDYFDNEFKGLVFESGGSCDLLDK